MAIFTGIKDDILYTLSRVGDYEDTRYICDKEQFKFDGMDVVILMTTNPQYNLTSTMSDLKGNLIECLNKAYFDKVRGCGFVIRAVVKKESGEYVLRQISHKINRGWVTLGTSSRILDGIETLVWLETLYSKKLHPLELIKLMSVFHLNYDNHVHTLNLETFDENYISFNDVLKFEDKGDSK